MFTLNEETYVQCSVCEIKLKDWESRVCLTADPDTNKCCGKLVCASCCTELKSCETCGCKNCAPTKIPTTQCETCGCECDCSGQNSQLIELSGDDEMTERKYQCHVCLHVNVPDALLLEFLLDRSGPSFKGDRKAASKAYYRSLEGKGEKETRKKKRPRPKKTEDDEDETEEEAEVVQPSIKVKVKVKPKVKEGDDNEDEDEEEEIAQPSIKVKLKPKVKKQEAAIQKLKKLHPKQLKSMLPP